MSPVTNIHWMIWSWAGFCACWSSGCCCSGLKYCMAWCQSLGSLLCISYFIHIMWWNYSKPGSSFGRQWFAKASFPHSAPSTVSLLCTLKLHHCNPIQLSLDNSDLIFWIHVVKTLCCILCGTESIPITGYLGFSLIRCCVLIDVK